MKWIRSRASGAHPRKPNGLDARRRRLLEGVSQGMSIAEAGRNAGYAYRQSAHRAFESIALRFPEALAAVVNPGEDCSVVRIFEKLRNLQDAKKLTIFKYRGVITEIHEDEAHDIQLRAAEEIFKLMGLL